MTVRHIVMWSVDADDPQRKSEIVDSIVAKLESLRETVPSLRSLTTGVNAYYGEANADVVLVTDFDDLEGLDAYQVHPAHQEVAAYVRSVVSGRMAVDFDV